jgi:uncharacterized protein YabE (DUF348 family)
LEPLGKNIKRYISFNGIIIAALFLAIIASVVAGQQVFNYYKKVVVINDNGNLSLVETMKTTVKDVLKQQGIEVSTTDYISVPLENNLLKRNDYYININRAIPIKVTIDGKEETFLTYKNTVQQALESEGITLSVVDKIDGADMEQKIVRDMSFKVIRVREKVITEETTLAYEVEKQKNTNMVKGEERTIRHGSEGLLEKTFKIITEDGVEVAKNLLNESILASPISQIVEFGTLLTHKSARGGLLRYRKVLDMRATAYTSNFADTGKSPGHPQFGITYSGKKAKEGIIAVDPRVIPLGTRMYVEVAGGTPDYGYCIAGDIGSAIKNDLIDLYFDSERTVDQWGCKRVKVYILD